MKTRLLFGIAAFCMVLSFKNADAAAISYTWKGTTNSLWSVSTNWMPNGHPGAADNITIANTTNKPDVDAVSQCASLTISGNAVTLTLSANLTVGTGGLLVNSSDFLTIATGSKQTLAINGDITANSSAKLTIMTNNTITCNSIALLSSSITNNAGTLTANSSFTLNSSGAFTNTGVFDMTGSTMLLVSPSTLTNSGTCDISGCAVTLNASSMIKNLAGGIFYIYENSSVSFNSSAAITNAGTFYAGKSGLDCTLNLSFSSSKITNTGVFYLGSTSVINVSGSAAAVANTGTFTIQSDANGSGAIGKITGTTPFTGTYNVERYITGGTDLRYRNYRYFSSPVYSSSQTLSPAGTGKVYDLQYLNTTNTSYPITTGSTGTAGGFDQAGNPTIYVYREDRNTNNSVFSGGNFIGVSNIKNAQLGYDNYNNTTTTGYLPAGNGFAFFYRGTKNALAGRTSLPITSLANYPNSTTVTQVGSLTQGSVPVILWYGTTGTNYQSTLPNTGNTTSSKGFILLGNPYACAIDWNTLGTGITSTNIGSTIYRFDVLTKQYDTYVTSGGSGTGNPVGTSGVILSGEGFFVQVLPTATSGTLTFTEAAKSTISPTQSSILMGTPAGQDVVKQLLRLKLVSDSLNHSDIAIGFNSTASEKFNGMEDAKYLTGVGAPEGLASFSTDSIQLAINFLPLPKTAPLKIRLDVEATNSGLLTLQRTQLDALPQIYEIWLMDKYKKDSLDLRNNTNYAFNVDKSDTSSFGNNRFELVIRQNPALGVHLLNFAATKATNSVQITWKVENEQNYTNFTVERSTNNGVTFDVLGGFLSDAQGTYSFPDKNPGNNVDRYRLKLEDLNGTVTYSKVVTINYSNNNTANNITIYPNPASGIINLTIGQNSVTTNLSGYQTNTIPALTSPGMQSYNIKIINITGSVVKTATSSQPNWQDDVSALSPGTYIIQVINNSDKSLVGKSTFVKM